MARLAEAAEHAARSGAGRAHRARNEVPDEQDQQDERRQRDQKVHPHARARVHVEGGTEALEVLVEPLAVRGVDTHPDRGRLGRRLEAEGVGPHLRGDAVVADDDRVLDHVAALDVLRELLPGGNLPAAALRVVEQEEQHDEQGEDHHPAHEAAAELHRRRGRRTLAVATLWPALRSPGTVVWPLILVLLLCHQVLLVLLRVPRCQPTSRRPSPSRCLGPGSVPRRTPPARSVRASGSKARRDCVR